MPSRVLQFALVCAIVLSSLALTTTAATLALRRPHLQRLNTETGSRLTADYSADPIGIRIAPLDPAIIEAAAADEDALAGDSERRERVEVAHVPTAAPTETMKQAPSALPETETPVPDQTNTPTPVPSSTPTALLSNTPTLAPTDTSAPELTSTSTHRSRAAPRRRCHRTHPRWRQRTRRRLN